MLTIGLFGIGLDTYWPQFDGLLHKLTTFQHNVAAELRKDNITLVDAGMVDNPAKANAAAKLFNEKNVDAIFLLITTYALSHNVLPVVQKTKKPLIILNLQPNKAIDYKTFNAIGDRGKMTGEWLAYCQSCVAPEISSVLNRAKIKFELITGYLQQTAVWNEVNDTIAALQLKKQMEHNRVGLLGHYYNGMLDVYTDVTLQATTFGNHFELLEMGTLKALRDNVTDAEIKTKIDDFEKTFAVSNECEIAELERAAKTAVALEKLVQQNDLGSLAYYYEGDGDAAYLDIVTSLIPGLTLLTGRNIPVAGEYEVKNVQAMKLMDLLGCGGSFSEFYAMDFEDEIVLLGHDGPAHFAIADGAIGLVPLPVYHGKPGKGLSIQMKVKNGAVTLLSVCQGADGNIFLLVAEGESVAGETLQIGNTNSRYKFPIPITQFMNEWSLAGPSHHCAIGMGHKASVFKKYAALIGIECKVVC
jgi:L-arabinose isomerase